MRYDLQVCVPFETSKKNESWSCYACLPQFWLCSSDLPSGADWCGPTKKFSFQWCRCFLFRFLLVSKTLQFNCTIPFSNLHAGVLLCQVLVLIMLHSPSEHLNVRYLCTCKDRGTSWNNTANPSSEMFVNAGQVRYEGSLIWWGGNDTETLIMILLNIFISAITWINFLSFESLIHSRWRRCSLCGWQKLCNKRFSACCFWYIFFF